MTTALRHIRVWGFVLIFVFGDAPVGQAQEEAPPTDATGTAEDPGALSPEEDLGLFDVPAGPAVGGPAVGEPVPTPSPAATPSPPAEATAKPDSSPTDLELETPEAVEARRSEFKDKLDLPDDVVEEIYKDPFSYLGNVRYEDIYVVQKMYARKQGRYYITAFGGGGNFFSQFHTSLVNGIGGGYYFSDHWGWEVFHGLFTHTFATQRHDLFLNQFELWSGKLQFRITYALSSALTFSPFYGKFAWLGVRVLHYDIYFLAGPALTLYEELTIGYGGVAGVGFRAFLNKWSSLGLEFRDYVYLEPVPAVIGASLGSTASQIASRFFVFLNLTVYFPKFAFMDEV